MTTYKEYMQNATKLGGWIRKLVTRGKLVTRDAYTDLGRSNITNVATSFISAFQQQQESCYALHYLKLLHAVLEK